MVDEFQDTNATQLELLELLGTDRFVVGDELQSIYGFRHADVRIFRAQRAALAEAGRAAELATNFRSRPDILGVIDDALGDLHGTAHVPFVAGREAAGGRGRRRAASSSCCSPTPRRPRRGRRSCCRRCPRRGRRGGRRRGSSRTGSRSWSGRRASRPRTSSCCCARRPTWRSSSGRSRSRACRRSPRAGAATGAASRCSTSAPTSARWPTRATSWRCSACSPRRWSG